MTEPLPDTWHTRDLPVLRTVVRLSDENGGDPVRIGDVETALDGLLSPDEIQTSARALADAGFFDTKGAMQRHVLRIGPVSGMARQAAGAWPGPESIYDRLVAQLEEIAEHGSDEVEKTKARKFLDALGGFSRDTAIAIIGSAAGVGMQ